jgi:hypothetical protein
MDANDLKYIIEIQSGGKNTVMLDDVGKPSIMVRVPKQTYKSLGIGESDATHPAWIINGVEKEYIFIGKYEASVDGDRAYSMPMRTPANGFSYDRAIEFCEKKGKGWHLITNAEWAAVALWCKANGYLPTGNSANGGCHEKRHERGIRPADMPEGEETKYIETGSGPISWTHDNSNEGISCMSGNVWEWCGGFRLMNGEIQIIPNNDAASHIDQSKSSKLWKAVLQNGSLVAPGTANTFKVNGCIAGDDAKKERIVGESIIDINCNKLNYTGDEVDASYGIAIDSSFADLKVEKGIEIPDILKVLAIVPEGKGHVGGFYSRNYGERLALRGGAYMEGQGSGIFALSLDGIRSLSRDFIGFRLAYVDVD